jgi:hypothetical protein
MPTPKIDKKAVDSEAQRLLGLSEEKLIEQLGIRATAIKLRPQLASEIALRATYDAKAMGPLDGVKELGRAILVRWAKELQKLACGDDAASVGDRKKLGDAFSIGKTTGAVLLTSGLVAIGCPLAIAPVIAAIVMTRFVGSVIDVFCQQSQAWVDGLS